MTHKIGDIVTPSPVAGWPKRLIGKRYVITALPKGARGVNYKAMPCDADGKIVAGQGLTTPDYGVEKVVSDTPAGVVTEIPYVVNPTAGEIVTPTGPQYPAGVYVVIGETDAERVRIVKIGDTSGRYWRAYSRLLRVLDADAVNEALAGLL